MDEKPTVQMDAYPERDPGGMDADSPPTIPIDDMFQEPAWPTPLDAPAPPGPPPAYQPPSLGTPPQAPSPGAGPAGHTVIMQQEASAPLLAWLAVIKGPGGPRGQVFTLDRETVIGRKAGQIVLGGDSYVSGQHAKVRLESSETDEETHTFVLYDLASANGTFAGDRETYRDNQIYRYELEDGDFLLVGETTLVFKQVELDEKA